MGWYGINKNSYETPKEAIFREFNNPKYKIIDMAQKQFNTMYIAYQEVETGTVRASVVLLRYDRKDRELMYKEMGEESEPFYYDCPERILKLLTPTTNEHALKWREQCWKNINTVKDMKKKKIGEGTVIKFKNEITFTNGFKADTFQLEKGWNGKGWIFRNFNSSVGYKITNWRKREFEILTEEQYQEMRKKEMKRIAIATGLYNKEERI